MAAKKIGDGLYLIAAKGANTFLLEDSDGLVLIDTGYPDMEGIILDAVRALGRGPRDLRHIVLTHAHIDHIGSLAALVTATGAQTWMHAIDAPIAEAGGPFRLLTAAPGLLSALLFRIFWKPGRTVVPARIDHHVTEGDVLPVAGGLKVIHLPGHCAGQIALVSERRNVLFAGDVAMNVVGLGAPIGYEDRTAGEASQRKVSRLAFDTLCLGHGKPIVGNASSKWRQRWPA